MHFRVVVAHPRRAVKKYHKKKLSFKWRVLFSLARRPSKEKMQLKAATGVGRRKQRTEKFSRKLILLLLLPSRRDFRMASSSETIPQIFSDSVGSLVMYLHFLTRFSNKIASQSRREFGIDKSRARISSKASVKAPSSIFLIAFDLWPSMRPTPHWTYLYIDI